MSVRPPWNLEAYACTNAWRPSTPACNGRRKKGGLNTLPRPLQRLHTILDKALSATAAVWPPLMAIFQWIHHAAQILDNPQHLSSAGVQALYQTLLDQLTAWIATDAGESCRAWGEHCLKLTRSYWSGLFHCYDVPDLPRTNNDLEHFFGTLRHHERRLTGRKALAPSLLVRGAVRVIAALISWNRPLSALELSQINLADWPAQRRQLQQLRQARVLQRRFRQHPDPYLAALEERLVKLDLPP